MSGAMNCSGWRVSGSAGRSTIRRRQIGGSTGRRHGAIGAAELLRREVRDGARGLSRIGAVSRCRRSVERCPSPFRGAVPAAEGAARGCWPSPGRPLFLSLAAASDRGRAIRIIRECRAKGKPRTPLVGEIGSRRDRHGGCRGVHRWLPRQPFLSLFGAPWPPAGCSARERYGCPVLLRLPMYRRTQLRQPWPCLMAPLRPSERGANRPGMPRSAAVATCSAGASPDQAAAARGMAGHAAGWLP